MNKFIRFGVVALMAMTFLSSCLKDTPTTDYSDTSIKPIVLVPNGNWPRTAEITPLALDFTTVPYEIKVYARVSWSKPLGKSIEVTFKEDDAAIANYNTKFGTNWVKLNSNAYSISALKVTIPADAQEAYVPVMLYPDKVNLAQNNMLAFSITDASGEPISTNYQSFLQPILIKNIYEDDYAMTGYFFHPSAPRGMAFDKYLYTVSDVVCEVDLGDLGGAGYWYRFAVSGSNMTNFQAMYSTPGGAASGFMTADNPGGIGYPGPAYPGTAPWVHSTYGNTYDAATKTFYVHTGYGGGATSQNGFSRQQYEKWVRK